METLFWDVLAANLDLLSFLQTELPTNFKMSTFPAHRCSSMDASKLTYLLGQIQQYRGMLAATEKAAERKLFAVHIYDEDKNLLETKIAVRVMAAQSIMRQCTMSK